MTIAKSSLSRETFMFTKLFRTHTQNRKLNPVCNRPQVRVTNFKIYFRDTIKRQSCVVDTKDKGRGRALSSPRFGTYWSAFVQRSPTSCPRTRSDQSQACVIRAPPLADEDTPPNRHRGGGGFSRRSFLVRKLGENSSRFLVIRIGIFHLWYRLFCNLNRFFDSIGFFWRFLQWKIFHIIFLLNF